MLMAKADVVPAAVIFWYQYDVHITFLDVSGPMCDLGQTQIAGTVRINEIAALSVSE